MKKELNGTYLRVLAGSEAVPASYGVMDVSVPRLVGNKHRVSDRNVPVPYISTGLMQYLTRAAPVTHLQRRRHCSAGELKTLESPWASKAGGGRGDASPAVEKSAGTSPQKL